MRANTWVCFGCRVAVRRGAHGQPEAKCSACGEAAFNLGHRIRIPEKGDVAAWNALHEAVRKAISSRVTFDRLFAVRRRHELERRVATLEQRESTPQRVKALRSLRKLLAAESAKAAS